MQQEKVERKWFVRFAAVLMNSGHIFWRASHYQEHTLSHREDPMRSAKSNNSFQKIYQRGNREASRSFE